MTRYTKLGSRREAPINTGAPGPDQVDADEVVVADVSASKPTDAVVTPTAAAADEASSSSSSSSSDSSPPSDSTPATTAAPASASKPAPSTSAAPMTITIANPDEPAKPKTKEQLLKRAKLLKLKAKKAKTPEAKKRFLKQAWDLERKSDDLSYTGKRTRDATDGGSGSSYNKKALPAPEAVVEGNPWKRMFAEQQTTEMDRSEQRRLKRIEERAAKVKCFACRGMGHEARDCPQALDAESNRIGEATNDNVARGITGKETVGICFRCGSTQHTLNKCRKLAPKVGDDLPFATCFVCGKRGHLSSKCPINKGRGVYPEGGCCKLCSSVEHLARVCPLSLRKDPNAGAGNTAALIDSIQPNSKSTGADEDHFHSLARKKLDVEEESKRTDKIDASSGNKKNKVIKF